MKKIFLSIFILCAGSLAMQADAALNDHFVTTWQTDLDFTYYPTSITIPTYPGETYDYSVDWNNDGIFDESGITGDITHDFGVAGIYTIRIKGDFPRIYFNNTATSKNKIISVDQWGAQKWTSMEGAFANTQNLEILANDTPDLSIATSMSRMFEHILNQTFATSGNWNWDTSNIIDMSRLFYGTRYFNVDISSWDTSNVTDMKFIFFATKFNQPLNSWDTSNVTDMSGMFYRNFIFNQPLNSWDTSNVTDMNRMFAFAFSFNQPLDDWDVSNVTNMSAMFQYAPFNQILKAWEPVNVTNMSSMFHGATAFDQNIGSWKIVSLLNASNMFLGATLSRDNYDALLWGWDTYPLQQGVNFHGGNSVYCDGQLARLNMINSDLWIITDAGLDCN